MFIVSRDRSAIARVLCTLALFLAFGVSVAGLPNASNADENSDAMDRLEAQIDMTQKEAWQSDYRQLLQEAERQRLNAVAARENYTRANRRNYPRGDARRQFLVDESTALSTLAEIEAEIEAFRADGRRDGVMPAWFYEVEEEPISLPKPAAKADHDPEDREGRNPIHFESE